MFFLRIYFAVCLIDWTALSTNALGNSANHGRLNHTLVVVDAANAVVICIADEDFYVTARLIVER